MKKESTDMIVERSGTYLVQYFQKNNICRKTIFAEKQYLQKNSIYRKNSIYIKTVFTQKQYLFTRRRGANTAHTQMGRPTHEAPTREYTHKHTQTQTNAQRGPTKYGAGSRRDIQRKAKKQEADFETETVKKAVPGPQLVLNVIVLRVGDFAQ